MRFRVTAIVLAAFGLGTPRLMAAQFGLQLSGEFTSVTFTMPVKLTQLPPDLERVRLQCQLTGNLGGTSLYTAASALEPLLKPTDEVLVTSGQLVTTMKVMIVLPIELFSTNVSGSLADYECRLSGYSKALKVWDLLDEAQTVAVFKVTPTPKVTGQFKW